jgi:hypothetical protein
VRQGVENPMFTTHPRCKENILKTQHMKATHKEKKEKKRKWRSVGYFIET